MKAVILAAREANRLLPLTKDMPQSMLRIGGKTILERQVETLRKAGIEEIVVITGPFSDKMTGVCKNIGIKAIYNPFYEVCGMVLSLWVVKEELKNGFLFLYSDILFDSEIVSGVLKSRDDICIGVRKGFPREEAEKVVEEGGVIKSINKVVQDGENGEFIGIAKFSSGGVSRLMKEIDVFAKKGGLNATLIEVLDSIIKSGRMIKMSDIGDAKFVDIDFPEDLEEAARLFL